MARCYVFVLLIWLTGLQLTSAYIIDEADPAGESAEFRTEAKDETDTGDESHTQKDHELLKRMLKFIDKKGFEKECTEEAIKKTSYILKQRKEKDKSTLRGNYQILQHGEESTASDRSWLAAIKSGICSGCVVTKICNHPPKYLSNDKSNCRKQVLVLASHIHSGKHKLKCNPRERYRSIDGTCNNLENPKWGAALSAFERIEFPDYADGLSEPRKSHSNKPLPNARDVSRKVHGSGADGTHPDSKTLSHLVMVWGSFSNHDMTLALATGINCELDNTDPECVNVKIPDDDEVFRKGKSRSSRLSEMRLTSRQRSVHCNQESMSTA
ncbi:heme peroxidase [Desmophyllum pertusum]|uniref:Heme peroxidase n=1 Tax=Desmophyllum pertusum TaxID=174260 RepID=A0A9X0D3H0_9CNID|nr:heme peroxidase [Desmophyllum pertusum]